MVFVKFALSAGVVVVVVVSVIVFVAGLVVVLVVPVVGFVGVRISSGICTIDQWKQHMLA